MEDLSIAVAPGIQEIDCNAGIDRRTIDPLVTCSEPAVSYSLVFSFQEWSFVFRKLVATQRPPAQSTSRTLMTVLMANEF
jgi:hypothetical protein